MFGILHSLSAAREQEAYYRRAQLMANRESERLRRAAAAWDVITSAPDSDFADVYWDNIKGCVVPVVRVETCIPSVRRA